MDIQIQEKVPENPMEYRSDRMTGIERAKDHSGSWRACSYILANQCFEALAYYSIQFNLVTFLGTVLHESNVVAARNYTNWQGTCYIMPLAGAIMADSYLGRYLTTIAFSVVYLLGMIAMSISASFLKAEGSSQSAVFFLGLYMVAIGAGGIKPCVSSFGADQFDDSDPAERLKKNSFFNWFFFPVSIGSLVAGTAVVWVQDRYGWALGLWLPTLFIALAIASFLMGSSRYRVQKPLGSPIVSVLQVVVAATRKWNVHLPQDDSLLHEKTLEADGGHNKLQHTPVLRFLDKAAVIVSSTEGCEESAAADPWRLCTVTQVEELKVIIGMFPIWATGVVLCAVFAQISSTFLLQGRTMNTHIISSTFDIPPASLASFDSLSILFWVPIYDRAIVPLAKRLLQITAGNKSSSNARGITELQRFGTGLLLSVLVMVTAALVETRRRRLAVTAHGDASMKMSILWQVPQYFLEGACVVFGSVGQLEFFYNEAPASMRSLCAALGLLTVAFGGYLSSIVVTVVACVTTRGGRGAGWIPDRDLDEGHLDRFFWLLAALSALNFVVFVCCARRYKRRKVQS